MEQNKLVAQIRVFPCQSGAELAKCVYHHLKVVDPLGIVLLSTNLMANHILLLNGPNLNLLGTREPHVYGTTTLQDIEQAASAQVAAAGAHLSCFQSNHEGELIDRIHAAKQQNIDAIVFNPGGFTHTSIALRDALAGVAIPFIEVHISNVYQREPFRHHSYLSGIAQGVISGLGTDGYRLALDYLLKTR